MRFWLALVLGALTCGSTLPAQQQERLFYGAEWRLLRAGEVEFRRTAAEQVDMTLRTQGLVGKLYSVSNQYRASFDPGWCALSLTLDAREGRRHKLTSVTYDRQKGRVSLLEKDLVRDTVAAQNEFDVPTCVHEVMGALQKLRELRPEPGATLTLPVSDGKKFVSARVDVLAREKVETPAGNFSTLKFEAFLFSGVLYRRKGRLFVWLSDDDRRLPVQIRVQMPFYIGTVTLQLEKVEN